ncbi:MAG: hypothetical protein ABSG62_20840 [Terracidiphilus sp.]
MRLAEPPLEAEAMRAEGVPVLGIQVRRPWQKHRLTILMVFGPGPIVVKSNNETEPFSTYSRMRSISNILRLGRCCAGTKATRENSTVRREL